jgi:hypothetical protein
MMPSENFSFERLFGAIGGFIGWWVGLIGQLGAYGLLTAAFYEPVEAIMGKSASSAVIAGIASIPSVIIVNFVVAKLFARAVR